MWFDIRKYDCLPSTNSFLKEHAQQGAMEGTVIIAERQTEGRGRLGRSFYSPAESGLYLSLLLRPTFRFIPAHFTCMAAVALCETAELFGITPSIKWVNDLYLCDSKVAGILTEGAFTEDGSWQYAIVGIGVNLVEPKGGFPPSLQQIAGALFEHDAPSLDSFAQELLYRFAAWYEDFDPQRLFSEYRSRLNCIGKQVEYLNAAERSVASVVDLCPDFRLLIRTHDGTLLRAGSGEILFLTE